MKKSGFRVVMAAVAAALFICSCINVDHTLGAMYVPANQDISVKVTEIPLPVCMDMADSIQTNLGASAVFGAINTPMCGRFHAESAFSITPTYDSLVIGGEPVFKEMVAVLSVEGNQSLTEDQAVIPQNIYAYQLNVKLDSSLIYNNSITPDKYGTKSILKENVVYTGGDEIKLYLTEDFARPILNMTFQQLDSAELFMENFYGIVIKTDDVEELDLGGRLNRLNLAYSYMSLTYTSTNSAGVRRDTTVEFSLGAYYSVCRYESSSQEYAQADPSDALYYEGFCGVKPKIKARALKDAIRGWAEKNNIELSRMLLTKASIVFPFEYAGDGEIYKAYPSNLFPCKRFRDDSGRVTFSPIEEIADTDMDHGELNLSLFHYKSDASIYVQKLLRTDDRDLTYLDDIWMMGTYSTTEGSYIDYKNYSMGVINGTGDERHPYLRFTYSLLLD